VLLFSLCTLLFVVIAALPVINLQLWVGIMIQTQPFFIAGIEDVGEARTSAFGAMGMFLFTFVASLVGMWYDSQHKPEAMEDENGGSDYHLSSDNLPNYGTSA
jgi:hypothetical protein